MLEAGADLHKKVVEDISNENYSSKIEKKIDSEDGIPKEQAIEPSY